MARLEEIDVEPRGTFASPSLAPMASSSRPKRTSKSYIQEVRRGGVLVFATGSGEAVDGAAEIMNRHGAKKVEELIGREPSRIMTAGASLPVSHETDVLLEQDRSAQTGRVRQPGDGARMFVW